MSEHDKHTAGPWEAVPEVTSGDNFLHSIYEADYKGLLIARCDQNGEYLEHARLIAAAPDLLAALKSLLFDAFEDAHPESVQAARAAIQKAEGQS